MVHHYGGCRDQGAYADILRLYEEGEVPNLEMAMFENTEEANLEGLVGVVNR